MRKNLIIGAGIIFVLLLAGALWLFSTSTTFTNSNDGNNNQTAPTEDPLDVTIDFYNTWLDALLSTTTNPYQSGLASSSVISEEVRAYIEQAQAEMKEGDLEPVICQSTNPQRIGGKAIYVKDTEAQIMILPRGLEVKSQYMAIVTLKAKDGLWQISNISCTQGEIAPIKEFDFDQTGFLLKQSVPAPLNPQNWHLVFEQLGQTGNTVPLFFNTESICITKDGTETVCDPDSLTEAIKVSVQADMSEEGGTVRKMRLD